MTLFVFLRHERRTSIAWAIGLALYVAMLGGVYASFDPADLDALIESYPEQLQEVFGGLGDFATVQGFLEAEIASYFPLVLGIFAVLLMTRHLAGAEEQGALDHLLARPVARASYYWHLLAAGVFVLAALLGAAALGGVVAFAFSTASPWELLGIVGLFAEFLPTGALYLALGGLVGSAFHARGPANLAGVAVVITWFAMDVAARLVEGISWITYLTPHGYQARSSLFTGALDPVYVVVTLGVAAALAWGGGRIFQHKDLYA